MKWYLIPLILGAVVMPWVGWPRELLMAFLEGGPINGFGFWFGLALGTTPIIFTIHIIGWFGLKALGVV